MSASPIVPRPAATLILVRDTAEGLEVFLMQRTHRAVFMPGVYVFPGGAVDEEDRNDELLPFCNGLDDASASRPLGLAQGGLGYLVAAIRECFEEAGLLLATDRRGEYVDIRAPDDIEAYAAFRARLAAGDATLADICRDRGLTLAVDRLAFFSHWVTPAGPPRRYDTRFFVAVAPAGQTPSEDGQEMIAHTWVRPAEALARGRRGELPLSTPTIRTLKALAAYPTAAALMEYAMSPREVVVALPRFATGRAGRRMFHPGDPPYAEICKLDPAEEGTASYEILPGVPVRLSASVVRLTAPNPSVMTGPGTNSYLIHGADGVAVIDPGPAIEEHVDRLIAAAEGAPIRWVLTTHTHADHSPGAALLRERTGAEVLGMPAPAGQDPSFWPDRVPADGDRLDLGGLGLRAIHTPGHASNHLCYLLEEERLLFAGDHIMQGSTVVINPPDGDMAAYLRSLEALAGEEIDYIAPAHGFLLDQPARVVDRLIAHRLAREAKVLAAVRERGPAREEELVPLAYQDVPEVMHRLAARSLLAHLIKLREDGAVTERDGRWALAR